MVHTFHNVFFCRDYLILYGLIKGLKPEEKKSNSLIMYAHKWGLVYI